MNKVKVIHHDYNHEVVISEHKGSNIPLKGEIEDCKVEFDVNTDGTINITKLIFPEPLYYRKDVVDTAQKLEEALKNPNCPSCVILKIAKSTRQDYIVPTYKELLKGIIDE
jgi:hypothetical protein